MKNLLVPLAAEISWFPLTSFKSAEHFAHTFGTFKDFEASLDQGEIDFAKPFYIKEHQALLAALDDQSADGLKACVGRFKYRMRKAPQFQHPTEGRVWAPLSGKQAMPTIQMLVTQMVSPVPLGTMGQIAQYMDTLWIHGMRENKVFSSHTPQFVGLVILALCGKQDVIAAPFSSLQRQVPAGVANDVEAFLGEMQDLLFDLSRLESAVVTLIHALRFPCQFFLGACLLCL